MYILLERYISNLTIQDMNLWAMQHDLFLTDKELDFSYEFLQKNWKTILAQHGIFDIDKYKEHFSEENFKKIKKLIKEARLKYGKYL